jgi:hypothetical protein
MQRSAQGGSPTDRRTRRLIAVGAVVLVVGGMLAVTQISNAGTRRFFGFTPRQQSSPSCPSSSPTKRWDTHRDLATSRRGQVENHAGDGQDSNAGAIERAARDRGRQRPQCTPSVEASSSSSASAAPGTGDNGGSTGGGTGGAGTVPPGGADGANNGLDVLGRDCTASQLAVHTGFQNGNQCVQTQFGEVGTADKNPSLLITDAPQQVAVGAEFTLKVSTRNLIRDRFLGAAKGGYYLESSFLNAQGLVRGHFHTACRQLASATEAPNPEPAPAFFVATEDGGGSATPDEVTINIPKEATAAAGTLQCAVWAGDGSHRIPMMQLAKQTPAFDAVRIVVTN